MNKLILLLFATALTTFTGCKNKDTRNPGQESELKATKVIKKTIDNRMVFVGETEANFLYTTQPRINGYLLKRYFANGGFVKKGDLLYEIDPEPYKIAVAEAKANLAAAVAQQTDAQSNYDRSVPLARINAVSKSDLDKVTAALASAKENTQAARQKLKQAQLNLGYTKLYAPDDGIASVTTPSPGDFVGAGTQFPVLNTISRLDTIQVVISLPMARYMEIIRNDSTPNPSYNNQELLSDISMELSDNSYFPIKGIYSYTKTTVNADSDALQMVVVFPNPGWRLKAGQFVRIHTNVGGAQEAVLIPQQAVFRTQNLYQAYTINDKGEVVIKNISVSGEHDGYWIVSEGVTPGEIVLTEGFFKARNGMKVKPIIKD